MEPEIAFNTGYLLGYFMRKGIVSTPVLDDEGNYRPLVDIEVPTNTLDPEAEKVKVIRVEVVS